MTLSAGILASFGMVLEEGSDEGLSVNTQGMDYTIPFSMGRVCASIKRTGKGLGGVVGKLLGVFGPLMEVQRLLLKEGFRTIRTGVFGGLLMSLHVIMHGVLSCFGNATGGTDKLTCGVFDVGEPRGSVVSLHRT